MKWFFQSSAVGLLALVGSFSLYGQNTAGTAEGTATTERGGINAQGSADATGQGVDAQAGVEARVDANNNNRGGGYYPDQNEPWFANEGLRNELELDDDQVERLTDIYNQTRSELQGRSTSDQLSDEARAERTREMRNQFDEQFAERAGNVFANENQRNRFNQLGMQYRGYSAFDNPRLQRQMNLNDTQRRQLQDLNNRWNTELESLRGTYASDRAGAEQRFNELRDRTRTNFQGILNDQQRTAYDEMVGDRFDFGADSYLGANANAQNNRRVGTGNQGSQIGTPQQPGGPQGSGIGTPGNVPQGSGIGTPSGPNDSVGGGTGTGASGTGAGGAGTGGTGASGSGTSGGGTSGSGN